MSNSKKTKRKLFSNSSLISLQILKCVNNFVSKKNPVVHQMRSFHEKKLKAIWQRKQILIFLTVKAFNSVLSMLTAVPFSALPVSFILIFSLKFHFEIWTAPLTLTYQGVSLPLSFCSSLYYYLECFASLRSLNIQHTFSSTR